MPEHMRVDSFAEPCLFCIPMKAFPRALCGESLWIIPLGDKECWIVIMADIQILPNPIKRRVGEIDFAWLVAFANDLSCLGLPINLCSIQRQCFGNAHAGNTEHFYQGTITQARLG